MDLYGLLSDSFTVLYADDVHTSQEAHVWTFTACYVIGFTVLFIRSFLTSYP
jgi:hypothetical protein